MTILLSLVIVLLLGFVVAFIVWNGKLVEQAKAADSRAKNAREELASEVDRIYLEVQGNLAQAQALVDQQSVNLKRESERVRQHYLD